MKRGVWHQFGDKSQKLALEQLENGQGVGVVLSPRDLTFQNATMYAEKYRDNDASVLIDHQFYLPEFTNKNTESYPTSSCQASITTLGEMSANSSSQIQASIDQINSDLKTDAIVAPAVVYEGGRPDIVDLNAKLFKIAKSVANNLGRPCYATFVLGRTVTSQEQLDSLISQVTSLNADGWYFGFEFSPSRIPTDTDELARFYQTCLTLAGTGKPVLHAFAGMTSPLSFSTGATGAAIGHSQNLWHFTRMRWAPPSKNGGGGDAPPRLFSAALWGTIVYPDEIALLPVSLANSIIEHTPYSATVTPNGALQWDRWSANKHLVHTVSSITSDLAALPTAREAATHTIQLLQASVDLHQKISNSGLTLRDDSNKYQENWKSSLETFVQDFSDDYDYLELMST